MDVALPLPQGAHFHVDVIYVNCKKIEQEAYDAQSKANTNTVYGQYYVYPLK